MDPKPEKEESPSPDVNPYHSPMAEVVEAGYAPVRDEGDATGGVIPYKNPHALIAYYLGIVSLLPLIGVPFGIASVVLGIIGLRKRKENPKIKGSVHAWIGILFGTFSLFCGGSILTAIIFVSVQG